MGSTTLKNRHEALDFLRGVAILGILPANILFFASPILMPMIAGALPKLTGPELLSEQITTAFVNGKFRSLLSILFGVGLWMQYERRTRSGEGWPQSYLRRMGFLALIGAFHAVFMWYGDILFIYAITAICVSLLLVKTETELLWLLFKLLLGASAIMGIGSGAMVATGGMGGEWLEEFGGLKAWLQNEQAVYASGTYIQQTGYRLVMFGLTIAQASIMVPALGGLFAVGMALARVGYLTVPSRHPVLSRNLLVAGLGIGLPLNLAAFALPTLKVLDGYQYFVEFFAGPLMSLGLVALGAILVERIRVSAILRPLSNVGRIALTSYLLQTVLCTMWFYSFGFAQFGRLDRVETWMVVGAVWAFNLVFAAVYLRFFEVGPVEALWRGWSDRKPIRLNPSRGTELRPGDAP